MDLKIFETQIEFYKSKNSFQSNLSCISFFFQKNVLSKPGRADQLNIDVYLNKTVERNNLWMSKGADLALFQIFHPHLQHSPSRVQ